jgi:hypothetical protein
MKQIISFILALTFSSFQQDSSVKVFGFYSNEKSLDGEHSTGYTLHLWKYKGSLIGTVSYNQGIIGDQTIEVINDVKYSNANGEFSFSSSLSGERVTFNGKVQPGKVVGTFLRGGMIDKNQSLKSCCKDAIIYKNYNTYNDWEKMLQQFK